MAKNKYFDEALKLLKSKAEEYKDNPKKAEDLLNKAMNKAQNIGPIEEVWDKLQLLFSIFKDWLSGSYKEIPTGSIVMIIISLIYFVSPLDAIADLIPFGGMVDDAAVIGFVVAQINSDLEKYKLWKSHQKQLT